MKLSKGNRKVPYANVSLTPIKSCKGCAAVCGKDCYAMKAYKQYPTTRAAWDHNYEQAKNDMAGYFSEIRTSLSKYKKSFFRWHVAGDILNHSYFVSMLDIARQFPTIKFLAFTKQYRIVNDFYATNSISLAMPWPANLTIVFSAWPNHEMQNPYNFPVAYMQDGTEKRIDGTELNCPGSCDGCGLCWELPKLKRNVVFNKH